MYDFEHMDQRLIIYAYIFLLANRLQTLMDAELQEITSKQWLALIMLKMFDEPPTLKQLAQMCNTSHQNTKQIVLKLEQKGFVKLVKDEKDGRALRIISEPKIEAFNAKYDTKSQSFIKEMFMDLTHEEIKSLCKTQIEVYERLEKMSIERMS